MPINSKEISVIKKSKEIDNGTKNITNTVIGVNLGKIFIHIRVSNRRSSR